MSNPFQGRKLQMGVPIIGMDPTKIISDFKREALARSQKAQSSESIEISSEPKPKIPIAKIDITQALIDYIGSEHALWLNNEMFFILPKNLYEACYNQNGDDPIKQQARAFLKSKNIRIEQTQDEYNFIATLYMGDEKLKENLVYFEEIKEDDCPDTPPKK